ncbi:MAG: Do family serine endopeptidase [Bacteroidales bacterium]
MKGKQWILSLLAGLIGGAAAFFAFAAINEKNESSSEEIQHALIESYKEQQHNNIRPTAGRSFAALGLPDADFSKAAEASLPAVVHITSFYNQQNYTLYDFIFGTRPEGGQQAEASGSGVIISNDGYIVTNRHVINNSEKIKVVLHDRRSYEAELIGADATTDIALLKIDADELTSINYGESDKLKVGEWVLAVGNPFNLTSTVTAGIVSAKARSINIFADNQSIESFIQTDAAVNPGNSGGALVNTDGELVGINTAIASRTGSFVGYSFAVPVGIVRKVVADLLEYGEVQRAYLGISLADVDSEIAERFNLEKTDGILVAGVTEGSAADEARVKTGDVILSINNKSVNTVSQLLEQISKYRPGDEVSLTFRRGNKEIKKSVVLRNKYGDTESVQSERLDELNAEFEALSLEEKRYLRLKYGVKVKKLYPGALMNRGVREGFIITSINDSPVKTVEDISHALDKLENESILIEGMYPNGSIAYYTLRL